MSFLAVNPIFDAYFHSDLFGKGIFLALLVLSLITWSLFLQKWRFYQDVQKKSVAIREQFLRKWQNPLLISLEGNSHPYASLFKSFQIEALDLIGRREKERVRVSKNDLEMLEEGVMTIAYSLIQNFEKNLFILSTIVTLAPFLGLLGTVWGILLTFSELQGGGLANANATVMNGLAMALGTTVVGLLVAIPALLAYNYLKAKLADYASEIEDFSKTLLLSLERHFTRSDTNP